MTSATYTFNRAHHDLAAFFSDRQPSTDARNALADWANNGDGRSYDVVADVDSDDELIAELSFSEKDDKASRELDNACTTHGIERA
jgi:hypothetical protein